MRLIFRITLAFRFPARNYQSQHHADSERNAHNRIRILTDLPIHRPRAGIGFTRQMLTSGFQPIDNGLQFRLGFIAPITTRGF